MTARELFDQGDLAGAVEAQNGVVKANPMDLDARHELSVYLCFAGNLDRAFLQLNMMAEQDPELAMASNVYRSLLIADQQRREVYHGEALPLLPPGCPAHTEARLDSLVARRRGDLEAAGKALDRAAESESNRAGKLNGEAFAGLRDCDDILGSVLEIFAGETYLWMPLDHIASLDISKPAHLLDLLYVPAQLVDIRGEEASVHLPTLYEGSHSAADGKVQTGRMTEWIEVEGVGYCGAGQRLLWVAGEQETKEIGLLEVDSLQFESGTPVGEPGG